MYYSFFFAILFLFSRGGLEVFLDKKIAYMLSFLCFFVFLLIFAFKVKSRFKIKKSVLVLSFSFIVSSFFSVLFSYLNGIEVIYFSYMVYPLFISLFFLFCMCFDFRFVVKDKLFFSISLIVYVLFFMALMQQIKIIELPGSTPLYDFPLNLNRPSSLTGSYLHYPLLMVVLGCFLYSVRGKLTFPAVLAFGSVFVAFSRSGMMLVTLIFFFQFVRQFLVVRFALDLKQYLKLMAFIVAFLFFSMYFSDLLINMVQRFLSSFDAQGVGNDERIRAWLVGIKLAFDGNFIFGDKFGTVTNLTGNLFGSESTIVESGLLQNIINFGLIGTVIFYSFLIYIFIKVRLSLEKCFIIAFIFQSLIYQSTEVLPFITCVFLLVPLSLGVNRKSLVRVL